MTAPMNPSHFPLMLYGPSLGNVPQSPSVWLLTAYVKFSLAASNEM